MKKYVFIGSSITSIGGGQIYYYNKSRYCEEKGWKVYIFTSNKGKLYIDALEKHEKYINNNMGVFPYFYSRSKVDKMIEWLLDCIDYKNGDEVIIESGGISYAMWGEMLAKACQGRHLAYFISEKIGLSNKSVYNFLEFKWQRKEFRCIKTKIMQEYFADKKLTEEQCYGFRAPCTNSMEDVEPTTDFSFDTQAPIIGIVGRLNKDYVYEALSEIIKFSDRHPDNFYNVLIVGGGEKEYYTRIKRMIKGVKNIDVIITGRIYPIPRKIIENMTVAIGSSGIVRLPWSVNVPSISVDLSSNKALGVLGYNTMNTQFPLANETTKDISEYLEELLYNSYAENHKEEYVPTNLISKQEIDEVFDMHFGYLEDVSPELEYFDEFVAEGIKSYLQKIVYSFGGHWLISFLKKVRVCLSK